MFICFFIKKASQSQKSRVDLKIHNKNLPIIFVKNKRITHINNYTLLTQKHFDK